MDKIKMTLEDLRYLLDQQKRLTIERLRGDSYLYNKESTAGSFISLPINEEKMLEVGLKSKYPNDYEVLKKYS